ncbi:MAG: DUF6858 family protein [Campylobacterota bacterium]
MKQVTFKEKYPVYELIVNKNESRFNSIDAFFAFFKEKIEAHPIAEYIAEFDHYAHTKSLPDNAVAEGMIDAKNLIFCFGKEIPTSRILAVRPRSIGIAEFEDRFEISILEVPNQNLHSLLEDWIKEVVKD